MSNNLDIFIPNQYCLHRGDETLPEKGLRGLNWKGRLKFRVMLYKDHAFLSKAYKIALKRKEVIVGPFWGEFGNFLLHFLPFVMHLHKMGLKVHVVCLEHYEPFFRNEANDRIYNSFISLSKSSLLDPPNGNSIKNIPADFLSLYNEAKIKSSIENIPFFDLSNSNLYWYSFRNWQLGAKQEFYKFHRSKSKKSKAVLFPRFKGPKYTLNNGARLDYSHIANILSNYFDEVVVVGLPEMSADSEYGNPRVKNRIGDNTVVINECIEAQLIVSQHSGAIHVGLYSNTPCLIIYHGVLPIKGLDDSIRFRANAETPHYLVTNDDEMNAFLNEFKLEFD